MYNTTILCLEFIQTTGSLRGRAKSSRPRRQVKKNRRRSYRYVENVFGRQHRHRALQPEFTLDVSLLACLSGVVECVVWIHSPIIMYFYIGANYAKQSQFCAFFTRKSRFYEKTNPIQTQFKANKAKNKPNKAKFKPNSKPITSLAHKRTKFM